MPDDLCTTHDVTRLLLEGEGANRVVLNRVIDLIYQDLCRLARGRLCSEPPGHTLDTSALVHEAYLKMVNEKHVKWRNRNHFLAVAATAMRRVLVDHARRHRARKRGGGRPPVPLEQARLAVEPRVDLLLELDAALDRLDAIEPRLRKVVEYRFFGGMTETEAAEALGVTSRTVRSDWAAAKGLLVLELGK